MKVALEDRWDLLVHGVRPDQPGLQDLWVLMVHPATPDQVAQQGPPDPPDLKAKAARMVEQETQDQVVYPALLDLVDREVLRVNSGNLGHQDREDPQENRDLLGQMDSPAL